MNRWLVSEAGKALMWGGQSGEYRLEMRTIQGNRIRRNVRSGHFTVSDVIEVCQSENGGPGRTRTYDQGIMSPLL
jgi:hypothetical protein